jgi:glycosyltransferase involved in cell wall biosynthesis
MKILFLDQFGDLGGAQHCLLDLLPAITERGWKAHVAVPTDGPLLTRARALGASTAPLPCGPYTRGPKNLGDWLRFASQAPDLVDRISSLAARADLLYVNGPRVLPAAVWAAVGRVPLLFHCHHRLSPGGGLWLVRRSLRTAQVPVVGNCRFVLDALKPDAAWTEVVYNGVAAPVASSGPAGLRRIGVIGRICEQKGPHLFIEAARLIKQQASYVLFGEPESTAYFDRLKSLARGLPVEFAGYQEGAATRLDLLVVPSASDEATTRVILEAWAACVPVVAFRTGGIQEIVEDGVNGFLVSQPTAQALARTLSTILEKPEALEAAAAAGHANWRARFTIERYRKEMLRVIERAAGTESLHRAR